MKKPLFFLFSILLLGIVMCGGVNAIDVSDVMWLFPFNGTGNIANLGTGTGVAKSMGAITTGSQVACYSNWNGCSLTDGNSNSMFQINQSTTGPASTVIRDGNNFTGYVLMKSVQDEASGDFFFGDNDALHFGEKDTMNLSLIQSNTSGTYPFRNVSEYAANTTWYNIWFFAKNNGTNIWYFCAKINHNGTEYCVGTPGKANGNYQLDDSFSFGDRSAGTKATKTYFQVFAGWNRTMTNAEMEYVQNKLLSADLDFSAVDMVSNVHLMEKSNQSIQYSWTNPDNLNHIEMWSNGIFIGNFTTSNYNISGRTNNTCYTTIFISVDDGGAKSSNKSKYDCTLQNNYNSIYMTPTDLTWGSFLLKGKYQNDRGMLGGEAFQQVYAIDFNKNPSYDHWIYTCTDTTKCWRSTTSGGNWTLIAKNISLEGASSIVSDYNNPTYVCAIFGRMSSNLPEGATEGLYCSEDGGINWDFKVNIPPRRQKNGQQIFYDTDSTNGTCSQNVYAGGDDGMYYSSNCGNTWTSLNSINEYVNDISGNVSGAYVSTNTSLYYLRFSDNNMSILTATGMTTSGNILRDCAVNASNPNNLICVATDAYESWDGGDSFSSLYNPASSLRNVHFGSASIILSPESVGGSYPYYSTDGGDTFGQPTLNTSEGVHYDFSWYFSSPVTCNSDESTCITAMDGAIAISNDYGATWHESSGGMGGARLMDAYFINQTSAYFAMWDYGLYKIDLLTGLVDDLETTGTGSDRSAGCVAVNSTTILTTYGTWSTPDMDLIRSVNSGTSWTTVLNSGGEDFYYCEFNEDNSLVVVADDYVSSDGGATWAANTDAVTASDQISGVFYGYKDNGATTGIYNSTNGNNWNLIVSVSCSSPQWGGVKVEPFDTNHFLLPCAASGIYDCDDGSCTLRDTAEGLSATSNYKWATFDPNIKNRAWTGKIPYYVSGYPAMIALTLDGGTSWIDYSNNLGNGTESYGVFINPYTTEDIYLTSAGILKSGYSLTPTCYGTLSCETNFVNPITNLQCPTVTNMSIYCNMTLPTDPDYNHTEVWRNGINILNLTGSLNYITDTPLSSATSYEHIFISVDYLGNKGTNATMTNTTLTNNITTSSDNPEFIRHYTGHYASTIVSLSSWSTQYLNVTFLQKPFIVNAWVTNNYTSLDLLQTKYDADSTSCQADFPGCIYESGEENDNDFGTDMVWDSSTVGLWKSVNHTFNMNYTFANKTNQIRIYTRIYNGDIYVYCLDSDTTSTLLGSWTADPGSYTLYDFNYTVPATCSNQATMTIAMMIRNRYGSGNLYLYETELVGVRSVNASLEGYAYQNKTTETDEVLTTNLTAYAREKSDDALLLFEFTNSGTGNINTNVSIDLFYNRTINVSIYQNGTTNRLNATCLYNGAAFYPNTALLYYNSSLTNQLNCSVASYFPLSEYIYPLYDSINFSMNGFSLNIVIKDEQTNLQVYQNFTLNLFDGVSYNFTIQNGNITLSAINYSSYKFEYWNNNFPKRTRYINSPYESSNITFYVLNTTQGTVKLFTVLDESSRAVEGAKVKMLRQFVDCNCFRIVEEVKSNDYGQGFLFAELYDATYQFIVEYNGVTEKITNETKLDTRDLAFSINLLTNSLEDFFKISKHVASSLSFSSGSDTWSFAVNDASGTTVSSARLEVVKEGMYGDTLICDSILYSGSGSVQCDQSPYANDTGIFKATGYVTTTNGVEFPATMSTMTYSKPYLTFGMNGLLMAFMVILVMVFVGSFKPDVMIVFYMFGMVLTYMTGILFLQISWFIGTVIVGLLFIKEMNI